MNFPANLERLALVSLQYPARFRVKTSIAPSTGERWALVEEPPPRPQKVRASDCAAG